MTLTDRSSAVSDGQLVNELRSRVLSGIHPNRIAAVAALIDGIDGDCWATAITAAGMHHFDGISLRPPYHLLLLRDHNVRRIGHAIHTTDTLPLIDRCLVDGVPCVSPTRALILIARELDRDALAIALDGAIRDGLTTEDFLHRRIADLRTRGRYGVPKLLDVLERQEIVRGGQSWLEREFLRLIAAAGLPIPETQVELSRRGRHLIRVDFRWPGTPVVVETLGYRWHRTGAQMAIDAERMNALVLDGYVPMQFTYSQVVRSADRVLDVTRTALEPYLDARTSTLLR